MVSQHLYHLTLNSLPVPLAKKSLEEIRGLLFRLKAEVFSSGGFKGTLLNVTGRSKRLDELFEQEIGNDLLSSVTKPR